LYQTNLGAPVPRCVVILIALTAAACGRSEPSVPSIGLIKPDSGPAFIQVIGLPASTLSSLSTTSRSPERWAEILRVSVSAGGTPILGDYRVVDRTLRFTPAFPFDPGRPYAVRFHAAAAGDTSAPIFGTFALPRPAATAATSVTAVYPSGDVVPENLLRMYVEFSGPMGGSGGIDHLQLLDQSGAVVEGAFLPLDYEFWNMERTRFTVFFDPGRVKRGILPNRQSGRALKRGQRYTLVVTPAWRDANGQPLKEEFRRTFTAGPAEMQPLDTASWKVEPPRGAGPVGPAGDSLTVTFPKPLDHGLLMRALGVRKDGREIDGDARLGAGETQWIFTPRQAWSPGRYELIALSFLEDPAGNQIGRAFEVDNFETVDKDPDPQTIAIPFVVG
jgi:hypothetical protein